MTEHDEEYRAEFAAQATFAAERDDPSLMPFTEEELVDLRRQGWRWGRAAAAAAALQAIGDPAALAALDAAREVAAQEGREDVIQTLDSAIDELEAVRIRREARAVPGRRQPKLAVAVAGLAILLGGTILLGHGLARGPSGFTSDGGDGDGGDGSDGGDGEETTETSTETSSGEPIDDTEKARQATKLRTTAERLESGTARIEVVDENTVDIDGVKVDRLSDDERD